MRYALAILKYVPAALCGLLVVAWVVSCIVGVCWSNRFVAVRVVLGSVDFSWYSEGYGRDGGIELLYCTDWKPSLTAMDYFGVVSLGGVSAKLWRMAFPIPFLLTLLLPLAIGPFTRFRFPLWSYFAWTALLAAELAYYLR